MATAVSPLAVALPDLPPLAGVRISAAAAGIRYQGRTDVVMMEVPPGSTVAGVIGEVLPHQKLVAALPGLHADLSADGWEAAARGIMTTDTFPKAATRAADIGGAKVRITGIAKGSGMIAPDMATMLCFVFTDAKIPAPALQALLSKGVETSFNCTTVDSDTSTSDTVMLFATGQARHPRVSDEGGKVLADFA